MPRGAYFSIFENANTHTHTHFLKRAPSSYLRVYPDDRTDGGERENVIRCCSAELKAAMF